MANITYLLGAGASSACLPIYANFKDRFSEFGELFGKNRHLYNELDEDYKRRADHLINIIDTLKDEFKFHSTPDTIAKKYFHRYGKNSRELNDLKEVLILFFIHQQTIDTTELQFKNLDNSLKDLIDKRYDAFIAALLKPISSTVEILEQFKILTWNYDLQFEKAFINYARSGLSNVQDTIQSYPRINGNSDYSIFDINKFSITHLNGIAYAKPYQHMGNDMISGFHTDDFSALKYLLDLHKSLHYHQNESQFVGGSSLLTFAWENQNADFTLNDIPILNQAKLIAKQTEVLVIIGYSFPTFNNAIDMKLFESMLELKKVYIQSPQSKEMISVLKEQWFKNSGHLRSENIIDLGYWHQFHIPNEWRLTFPTQYSFA